MGVRTLTHYLNHHSSANTPAVKINLSQTAVKKKEYEAKNNKTLPITKSTSVSSTALDEHKDDPTIPDISIYLDTPRLVLIVDGLGVLFDLCRLDGFYARALPSYDLLNERISCFVKTFQSQNICLIFYFDTMSTHDIKQTEKTKRSTERLYELCKINQLLTATSISSYTPLTISPDTHETFESFSLQLLNWQVHNSLTELGVPIIRCNDEADIKISADCRKYQNQIYAVISNDSDCACMTGVRWIPSDSIQFNWAPAQPNQSSPLYMRDDMREYFSKQRGTETLRLNSHSLAESISNLSIVSSSSFLLVSITCQCWSNTSVLAALGLPHYPMLLTELAILTGNDFTKPTVMNSVKSFIERSRRVFRRGWTVETVAEYLRKPDNHLKRVEKMPELISLFNTFGVEWSSSINHSRLMYEGVTSTSINHERIEGISPATFAFLRHRVSLRLLPASTIGSIAKDEFYSGLKFERINSLHVNLTRDISSGLIIPSIELLNRPFRAAHYLLLGKKYHNIYRPDETSFGLMENPLYYQSILFNYPPFPIKTSVENGDIPLQYVETMSQANKLLFLIAPLLAYVPVSSPDQPLYQLYHSSTLALLSAHSNLPPSLRLSLLCINYLRLSYQKFQISPNLLKSFFPALLGMTTFLYLTHNSSNQYISVQINDPPSRPFPIDLTIIMSFSSTYQAVLDDLRAFITALAISSSILPIPTPLQLFNGPLFIFLLAQYHYRNNNQTNPQSDKSNMIYPVVEPLIESFEKKLIQLIDTHPVLALRSIIMLPSMERLREVFELVSLYFTHDINHPSNINQINHLSVKSDKQVRIPHPPLTATTESNAINRNLFLPLSSLSSLSSSSTSSSSSSSASALLSSSFPLAASNTSISATPIIDPGKKKPKTRWVVKKILSSTQLQDTANPLPTPSPLDQNIIKSINIPIETPEKSKKKNNRRKKKKKEKLTVFQQSQK